MPSESSPSCSSPPFIAAAQTTDYKGYKTPTCHPHCRTTSSPRKTPWSTSRSKHLNSPSRTGLRAPRAPLHYTYSFDESAGTSPGFPQIVRNYAAARKIGARFSPTTSAVHHTHRQERPGDGSPWRPSTREEYELNIIERQLMKQDVVADAPPSARVDGQCRGSARILFDSESPISSRNPSRRCQVARCCRPTRLKAW